MAQVRFGFNRWNQSTLPPPSSCSHHMLHNIKLHPTFLAGREETLNLSYSFERSFTNWKSNCQTCFQNNLLLQQKVLIIDSRYSKEVNIKFWLLKFSLLIALSICPSGSWKSRSCPSVEVLSVRSLRSWNQDCDPSPSICRSRSFPRNNCRRRCCLKSTAAAVRSGNLQAPTDSENGSWIVQAVREKMRRLKNEVAAAAEQDVNRSWNAEKGLLKLCGGSRSCWELGEQCSAVRSKRGRRRREEVFDLRHGSDFTGRSRSGGSGSGPLQH